MVVHENYSLRELNTFGVNAKARYFTAFQSVDELSDILTETKFENIPKMILGGGSNVLFTSDFDGLVIHNDIKGIVEQKIDNENVLLEIGGGEEWDDVVEFAVNKNYGGIENLSLIPGSAAAAPVQNIGAYGVELEEVFHSLEGVFINSGEKNVFNKEECNFGYRSSVFKNELKNSFIITKIKLQLSLHPKANLSYASLRNVFDNENVTIQQVREKVIEIRNSKLPQPAELNNAGSFFKNPIVNKQQLEELLKNYPDTIYFQLPGDQYKIAAGWLIENAGLKGFKKGNVGTYHKQALVIVNYGEEKGEEILNFAKLIQAEVLEKFSILLEPEVNII